MAVYVVVTKECYLADTHIPIGQMIEFVDIPEELLEHVKMVTSLDEVECIRAELPIDNTNED